MALWQPAAISNFIGFHSDDAEKEELRDLSVFAYEIANECQPFFVQNSVSLRARTGPRTKFVSTRNLARENVKAVCP